MTIGKTIRKIRKEKGLTQVDLSKKIGLSQVSITSIETDRYSPSKLNLESIINSLGVSLEYLYFRSIEDFQVDSDLEVEFEVYFKKLKKIIEQSNNL